MNRWIFSLFLILVSMVPLAADEVDDLLALVEMELENESYTRAIALLEEGKRSRPAEYRLYARAGDLYLARELHRLALAEYRRAAELAPSVHHLQWDIAVALGYLGKNGEAVDTLELLLNRLSSDDAETPGRTLRDSTIDDLSWMYFKTDRFDEGISLLEGELENRFDAYWAHTLGTLYSGKYSLDESRKWYLRSIDAALERGDSLFASIACYNMSLLEFSFYRYDEARERAMMSLDLRDRAGGHLVVGELDFLAWDLPGALESYRNAESMDDTPLARMDLAEYHLRTGYLDVAIRYLDEAEGSGDESWMYRFGLDSTRFGMDLSEMRRDVFAGKAAVEKLTPRAGLIARFSGVRNRLRWKAVSMYQDRKYRALTGSHVRDLRTKGGNELDAAWYAAMAHRGYRRRALVYLEEARKLETAFAPDAEPWYLLELGVERSSSRYLMDALAGFGPREGEPVERALRELAASGNRRVETESRDALARLYRINPGGLRQYGLSLPVAVVSSGNIPPGVPRRIRRLLRRSGYRLTESSDPGPDISVLRIVGAEGGRMRWYFEDPDGVGRSAAETGGISRGRKLAPVLEGLLDGFYATPLGGGFG